MRQITIGLVVAGLVVGAFCSAAMAASAVTLPFVAGTQSELEYILCEGFEPRDCFPDGELSNFIPAYSNSLQRLSLMRYVSTSATNAWERSNAAQVVQQLESVPTNQLNNISWIAEDVPGGN